MGDRYEGSGEEGDVCDAMGWYGFFKSQMDEATDEILSAL